MSSHLRVLAVVMAALVGSASTFAFASAVVLDASSSTWFLQAIGAWFGGGLGVLAVIARGAQRRRALTGYVIGLALNALAIVPLYYRDRLDALGSGSWPMVGYAIGWLWGRSLSSSAALLAQRPPSGLTGPW
jgi:hypothetical protein